MNQDITTHCFRSIQKDPTGNVITLFTRFHSIRFPNVRTPYNLPLKKVHASPFLPIQHQSKHIATFFSFASKLVMASNKIPATILVLSLLAYSTFTGANGCPPKPSPAPAPAQEKCPKDTLKLGVCADLLGLVNVVIGNPPSGTPCCTLIKGLADLEAALCLCTAIKGNVLGLNLNVPITLSLILSACQKTVPPGFQCP